MRLLSGIRVASIAVAPDGATTSSNAKARPQLKRELTERQKTLRRALNAIHLRASAVETLGHQPSSDQAAAARADLRRVQAVFDECLDEVDEILEFAKARNVDERRLSFDDLAPLWE